MGRRGLLPEHRAGGLIAHYNGTGWKIWKIKHGNWNELYGVKATSATNVWAVGYYDNGAQHVQILHYDGTKWSFQTANGDHDYSVLNAVAATGTGNGFAVGDFENSSGGIGTLVFHYGA